jgi:hypothetical protein
VAGSFAVFAEAVFGFLSKTSNAQLGQDHGQITRNDEKNCDATLSSSERTAANGAILPEVGQ